MRIVFMGTSNFSATILRALASKHEILAVYTKPDSFRRGGKIQIQSPVAKLAEELSLPCEMPDSLKDAEVFSGLKSLNPECICVAAYGLILPKEVLELPKYGCINVHASLLPQWRGAAPMQRAILSGQKTTGVSVMRMEEGLDTGPYCLEREIEIGNIKLDELESELASLGSKALLESLELLKNGDAKFESQDESKASYAEKIGKQELYLKPEDKTAFAFAKFRASNSANPCRCKLAGKEIRITDLSETSNEAADKIKNLFNIDEPTGQLIFFQKRLYMGFSDGWLEAKELVPAGKNAMLASAFASGIQGIKKEAAQWEAV